MPAATSEPEASRWIAPLGDATRSDGPAEAIDAQLGRGRLDLGPDRDLGVVGVVAVVRGTVVVAVTTFVPPPPPLERMITAATTTPTRASAPTM